VTATNILFVAIGATAFVGGLALLFTALRHHRANHPKGVAMLIGGMMITAFGLMLSGFAIAYTTAGPAR
jgi:drug/metabolite transporter (DMT)-like permease